MLSVKDLLDTDTHFISRVLLFGFPIHSPPRFFYLIQIKLNSVGVAYRLLNLILELLAAVINRIFTLSTYAQVYAADIRIITGLIFVFTSPTLSSKDICRRIPISTKDNHYGVCTHWYNLVPVTRREYNLACSNELSLKLCPP